MQTQFTPEVIDVIRLQALGSLRWRVLLGYPPMTMKLEAILAPLARRDHQIEAALRLWSQACAVAREGGARSPTALRTAIARLADLVAGADRLGALAAAARETTVKALCGRSTVAAAAHLRSVRHVFEEYLSLRNRLVTAHLGLVRLAVRRLQVPGGRHEDMVHEGVFGLIRALECFDALRGEHFSTYATHWIDDEIARAMATHEPSSEDPRASARDLACDDRNHRTPRLRRLGDAARAVGGPRFGDEALMADSAAHRPIGDGHVLPSDSVGLQDRDRVSFEELWLALPTLAPHERRIIGHQFELGGHEYRTFEELSDDLGLSHERVQKIQVHALEKLRLRIGEMSSNVRPPSHQASSLRISRTTGVGR